MDPDSAQDDGDDGLEPDMSAWPTGRLLSTAARMVEHAWHGSLDSLGLTHAGLVVLHLLKSGPLPQKELAARARVEVQTMSRTIDRLERAGHIVRRVDEADRRRQLVSSTPEGESAWTKAHTLETDVFPVLREREGVLREALLDIIEASSSDRWG